MLPESPDVHQRDAQRTRARILEAARGLFARQGFTCTTVREIAAAAEVSPNLITRYFGGKAGLFAEATAVELNVPSALPGPWPELGRRIAHGVVRRWESVEYEDPIMMMMRSAGSSEEADQIFADFLEKQALLPLKRYLVAEKAYSPAGALDVAASVVPLIMGVITARYVVRAGPLARADPLAVETWLGDRLQRLLDDPPPPALVPGRQEKQKRTPRERSDR